MSTGATCLHHDAPQIFGRNIGHDEKDRFWPRREDSVGQEGGLVHPHAPCCPGQSLFSYHVWGQRAGLRDRHLFDAGKRPAAALFSCRCEDLSSSLQWCGACKTAL
eukprot:1158635-Pelagomonas_calceolata.AAC.6